MRAGGVHVIIYYIILSVQNWNMVYATNGLTRCYVANYTCTLSRQAERVRRQRNILTCTTMQSQACFPEFGNSTVRLVDSTMGRISDFTPHAFDYRHVDTLNVYADLTQIPSHALRYLTSLEILSIDRAPVPTPIRDLLSVDIHTKAFENADSLQELTFRRIDFSLASKHRHRHRRRNSIWSKAPGPALEKASGLTRLNFDRCQFDYLDRNFFGDQYVTELTLTSCVILEGGGFSNDALDGYKHSLEQLVIKDTSLRSFPYAVRRLRSLAKLILSGSNLKYIPDDAFLDNIPSTHSATSFIDSVTPTANNIILQELDLSFNRLQYIGPKAFCSLVDLTELNLEGNPTFVALPADVFLENRRLKSINLRDCIRLRSLSMEHLRGLENSLIRLTLRNCRSLSTFQVSNLTRLRELDAQGCAVESLKKGMFGRQQRFTDGIMNVNNNPLKIIESGALDGVDLPRAWSIRNTHLKLLDLSSAFSGTGSLSRLELKSNTMLANISVSDVRKVPATLREIKLGSNGDFRLSDFDKSLRRFFTERRARLILEEGLLCSCEWSWLMVPDMKPLVDFQDSDASSRWWSARSSVVSDSSVDEDKAHCCNAVATTGANGTLYAHSFLANFKEYCGEHAPRKDRLMESCNSRSTSSAHGQYVETGMMMVSVLICLMMIGIG